jgi:hypothetical protein
MKMTRAASFSGLLLGVWLLLIVVPAFAADNSPKPFVIYPDKFMASQPLSEILKMTPPIQPRPWTIRK